MNAAASDAAEQLRAASAPSDAAETRLTASAKWAAAAQTEVASQSACSARDRNGQSAPRSIADGAGEDPRLEVYDLSNDLSEEHNLVDARPKLSAGLSDELFTWLRQVGAGIPIVKATDEPGA